MPTPAYLSIEGTKQGLITAGTFTEDSVGNIFQEGHEDQVLVQGYNHQASEKITSGWIPIRRPRCTAIPIPDTTPSIIISP